MADTPSHLLTVQLPDKSALNPFADDFAAQMRALIARAKRSMFAAQQRQKRYHDDNRTDKQFAVGDKVLLSTANLALKILRNGTRKLAPKWVGPFTVTESVGIVPTRPMHPTEIKPLHVLTPVGLTPRQDWLTLQECIWPIVSDQVELRTR